MKVWCFLGSILVLINLCKSEDYFLGYAKAKLKAIRTKKDFSVFHPGSKKCLTDLFKYVDDVNARKSWAVYMNEAGANYIKPDELLQGTWDQGHLADYGIGYQKCLGLKYEGITGKFCVLNLNVEKFIENLPEHIQNSEHVQNFIEMLTEGKINETNRYFHSSTPIRLRLAACLPDSCTAEILNSLNLLPEITDVAHCHTNKQMEEYRSLKALDWSFIIFMLSILTITAISTYRDLLHEKHDQKPNGSLVEALSAFSLVENIKELSGYSGKNDKKKISSIDGCRSFGIFLEFVFHVFYVHLNIPILNWRQATYIFTEPVKVFFLQLHVIVDTYYIIGGLLMVYNFLKKHDSTGGVHFSPIRHYLNRYLRITPAIAVVLWYHCTLFRVTNLTLEPPGPLWHEDPKGDGILYHYVGNCKRNFWAILLHFQNILYPFDMCLEQLWYIGTDFQATLISPIILLFMANKNYGTSTKLVIISLLAMFMTSLSFSIFFYYGWSAIVRNNYGRFDFHVVYYMNPLTKLYPWFIGLVFGFMLYHSRENHSLNKWLSFHRNRYILWASSGFVLLYCSHGLLFLPDQKSANLHGWNAFLHAFYATTYRAFWVTMLGFIIYTWQIIIPNGTGNKFMSNLFFQMFSKISFSLYVFHMTFCYLRNRYFQGTALVNSYSVLAEGVGLTPIHIIFGTILYLGIELPFSKLTKMILPPEKIPIKNKDTQNNLIKSTNRKIQ